MFAFTIENITKSLGAVTAAIAMIGGVYGLRDRLWSRPVLTWHAEHFEISSAPVQGRFDVIVAREKHRDDCTVEAFVLQVRDSGYRMHTATPSIAKFSGPATPKVDRFGYQFTIDAEHHERVARGRAQLIATITYRCPEGQVLVTYPDHDRLRFEIL